MGSLTFKTLNAANIVRCVRTFHPLTDWTPTDWATALAGECGEACHLIKELRCGDDIRPTDVADELADVVIYADLLCARLCTSLEAAVVRKFNEVSERKGSKIRLPRRKVQYQTVRNLTSPGGPYSREKRRKAKTR